MTHLPHPIQIGAPLAERRVDRGAKPRFIQHRRQVQYRAAQTGEPKWSSHGDILGHKIARSKNIDLARYRAAARCRNCKLDPRGRRDVQPQPTRRALVGKNRSPPGEEERRKVSFVLRQTLYTDLEYAPVDLAPRPHTNALPDDAI
jgi:hypothetical protein